MRRKYSEVTSIWVHPEYKRMVKTQASVQGLSILDYTKKEARKIKKPNVNDNDYFKMQF
jgi:hypothetical protein